MTKRKIYLTYEDALLVISWIIVSLVYQIFVGVLDGTQAEELFYLANLICCRNEC